MCDAADMILLQTDLHVLYAGVQEGRRTFGNIMKYIMMVTSSNFGNMISMAGASLFLPFLPMLPTQILLNNILYDVSELPIPLDKVDVEETRRPHTLDMPFIRNFMVVIGAVSSVFDFLTFYIMLAVLHADAYFEFVPLPGTYYVMLGVMVVIYLGVVQLAKQRFYRWYAIRTKAR